MRLTGTFLLQSVFHGKNGRDYCDLLDSESGSVIKLTIPQELQPPSFSTGLRFDLDAEIAVFDYQGQKSLTVREAEFSDMKNVFEV